METYLRSFKVQVITDLQSVYGDYFRGHEGILDELFENFIYAVKTGNTSQIKNLYRKVQGLQNHEYTQIVHAFVVVLLLCLLSVFPRHSSTFIWPLFSPTLAAGSSK